TRPARGGNPVSRPAPIVAKWVTPRGRWSALTQRTGWHPAAPPAFADGAASPRAAGLARRRESNRALGTTRSTRELTSARHIAFETRGNPSCLGAHGPARASPPRRLYPRVLPPAAGHRLAGLSRGRLRLRRLPDRRPAGNTGGGEGRAGRGRRAAVHARARGRTRGPAPGGGPAALGAGAARRFEEGPAAERTRRARCPAGRGAHRRRGVAARAGAAGGAVPDRRDRRERPRPRAAGA